MHDLDRSDLVFESDGFDRGLEELDEGELDPDSGELEEGELDDDAHEVFDGSEQNELANRLLEVTDDEELDQFLGTVLKSAVRKLGPLARGMSGPLGGLIKGAIKTALPSLASIAGGAVGGPFGAMIAGKAAPLLGKVFGMELEGLSSEDQELEAAKQLVRMAGSAVSNAINAAGQGSPAQVAQQAVVEAARRYAPGLVRSRYGGGAGRARRGTWYRRGNRIILVGV
jgi:hypothetical protein